MTEAAQHVAPAFRQKDKNPKGKAYDTRTNIGLLGANLTRMQQRKPGYHSNLELLTRMNLPVTNGILPLWRKQTSGSNIS